jgi:hypothetical protein
VDFSSNTRTRYNTSNWKWEEEMNQQQKMILAFLMIMGFLLLSCTPGQKSIPIKPAAGTWEGWIDSPTSEGAERHYWVQFEVNEDGTLVKDKVKDVWVAYVTGPIKGGDLYQNTRAEKSEIVGDHFLSHARAWMPTGGFPPTFYKVYLELEGTFVEPDKLEGSFKSNEDDGWKSEGKWTAARISK